MTHTLALNEFYKAELVTALAQAGIDGSKFSKSEAWKQVRTNDKAFNSLPAKKKINWT